MKLHVFVLTLLILALCAAGTVQAELARVGPIDAANGFPTWYQDGAGLALDFCLPNATELQNGTCLLLPADIPDPTQPISFPGNFPVEAFWWNATSTMNVNGGQALLQISLEGSFLNGAVTPGEQVSFARIRIRVDTPGPGSYRVIYPFGEKTFNVTALKRRGIDYTFDVGFVPGNFELAMTGPVGPYLLASDVPGGVALPFVTLAGGNLYLADPTITTALTGSPFNTNYFRIEGPAIGGAGVDFVENDQFTLLGRVHPGAIPSILTGKRATYARNGSGAWIDVFASAEAAIGTPLPVLSFTGAGILGRIMKDNGGEFYGQGTPIDPNAVPPTITVTNNSDTPPSSVELQLTDIVTITQATFIGGTLSVQATSSDELFPPALAVEDFGPMTSGQLIVPALVAPPARVKVISAAGGSSTLEVTTQAEPVVGPLVTDDTAITDADQPVTIDVAANDAGPIASLRILGNPAHGTAALVACPPPSTSISCILYTPTLYYFGADLITYVVQDGASVDSNVGSVVITINFVNHNPVAVDDAISAPKNLDTIINVLANDMDPDGTATLDPASVTIIDPPTAGIAVVDPATGNITYTAPDLEGVFTFTYQVSDTSLPVLTSNIATVTITVFQADGLNVTKAVYRTGNLQWTFVGTAIIPGPGNTITVHVGPTLAGAVIGTGEVDALGDWKIVVKNSNVVPDDTQTVSVESSHNAQFLGYGIKIRN